MGTYIVGLDGVFSEYLPQNRFEHPSSIRLHGRNSSSLHRRDSTPSSPEVAKSGHSGEEHLTERCTQVSVAVIVPDQDPSALLKRHRTRRKHQATKTTFPGRKRYRPEQAKFRREPFKLQVAKDAKTTAKQLEWLLSQPSSRKRESKELCNSGATTDRGPTNEATPGPSNEGTSERKTRLCPSSTRWKPEHLSRSLTDFSPSNPVIESPEIERKGKAMKKILDYYAKNPRGGRNDPLDFCEEDGISRNYPDKYAVRKNPFWRTPYQERSPLKTCNTHSGQVHCRGEDKTVPKRAQRHDFNDTVLKSERKEHEMVRQPYLFVVATDDEADNDDTVDRHVECREAAHNAHRTDRCVTWKEERDEEVGKLKLGDAKYRILKRNPLEKKESPGKYAHLISSVPTDGLSKIRIVTDEGWEEILDKNAKIQEKSKRRRAHATFNLEKKNLNKTAGKHDGGHLRQSKTVKHDYTTSAEHNKSETDEFSSESGGVAKCYKRRGCSKNRTEKKKCQKLSLKQRRIRKKSECSSDSSELKVHKRRGGAAKDWVPRKKQHTKMNKKKDSDEYLTSSDESLEIHGIKGSGNKDRMEKKEKKPVKIRGILKKSVDLTSSDEAEEIKPRGGALKNTRDEKHKERCARRRCTNHIAEKKKRHKLCLKQRRNRKRSNSSSESSDELEGVRKRRGGAVKEATRKMKHKDEKKRLVKKDSDDSSISSENSDSIPGRKGDEELVAMKKKHSRVNIENGFDESPTSSDESEGIHGHKGGFNKDRVEKKEKKSVKIVGILKNFDDFTSSDEAEEMKPRGGALKNIRDEKHKQRRTRRRCTTYTAEKKKRHMLRSKQRRNRAKSDSSSESSDELEVQKRRERRRERRVRRRCTEYIAEKKKRHKLQRHNRKQSNSSSESSDELDGVCKQRGGTVKESDRKKKRNNKKKRLVKKNDDDSSVSSEDSDTAPQRKADGAEDLRARKKKRKDKKKRFGKKDTNNSSVSSEDLEDTLPGCKADGAEDLMARKNKQKGKKKRLVKKDSNHSSVSSEDSDTIPGQGDAAEDLVARKNKSNPEKDFDASPSEGIRGLNEGITKDRGEKNEQEAGKVLGIMKKLDDFILSDEMEEMKPPPDQGGGLKNIEGEKPEGDRNRRVTLQINDSPASFKILGGEVSAAEDQPEKANQKVEQNELSAFDRLLDHPKLNQNEAKIYRDTMLKRAQNQWWQPLNDLNERGVRRGTKNADVGLKKERKLKHDPKGLKLKTTIRKWRQNRPKRRLKAIEEEGSVNPLIESDFQFDANHSIFMANVEPTDGVTNEEETLDGASVKSKDCESTTASTATVVAADQPLQPTDKGFKNQRRKLNSFLQKLSKGRNGLKKESEHRETSGATQLVGTKDELIDLVLRVVHIKEEKNDEAKKPAEGEKLIRSDLKCLREHKNGLQKKSDQGDTSVGTTSLEDEDEVLKDSNLRAAARKQESTDEDKQPVKTKKLMRFEPRRHREPKKEQLRKSRWHDEDSSDSSDKKMCSAATQTCKLRTLISTADKNHTTPMARHNARGVTQPVRPLRRRTPPPSLEKRSLPVKQRYCTRSPGPPQHWHREPVHDRQYQTGGSSPATTSKNPTGEVSYAKSSPYQLANATYGRTSQDQPALINAGASPYHFPNPTYGGTLQDQPASINAGALPYHFPNPAYGGSTQNHPGELTYHARAPPSQSAGAIFGAAVPMPAYFPGASLNTPMAPAFQSGIPQNKREESGFGGSIQYGARVMDSKNPSGLEGRTSNVANVPQDSPPPEKKESGMKDGKKDSIKAQDPHTPCQHKPCCCDRSTPKHCCEDNTANDSCERKIVTCGNDNFQMQFPFPDCDSDKQIQIKVPRQMFTAGSKTRDTCTPTQFFRMSKPSSFQTKPRVPRSYQTPPCPPGAQQQPLKIRVECNAQGPAHFRGRGRNRTLVIPTGGGNYGGALGLNLLKNLRTMLFGGGYHEVCVPTRCRPRRKPRQKNRQAVEPEHQTEEHSPEEDENTLRSFGGGPDQVSIVSPLQLYNLKRMVEGGANLIPDMLRQFIPQPKVKRDPVQSKFIKRYVKSYLDHHLKRQKYEELNLAKKRQLQLQLVNDYLEFLAQNTKYGDKGHRRSKSYDQTDDDYETDDDYLTDDDEIDDKYYSTDPDRTDDEECETRGWDTLDEGSDVEYLKKSSHWVMSKRGSSLLSSGITKSANTVPSGSSVSAAVQPSGVTADPSTWEGVSSTKYYMFQ